MLSRTERCSSEVSCVTMPIMLAQAVLLHRRDVLAVDQDAALLEVVEAQQQIDDGRLAGAGASDDADLLARPDRQVEVADDPARLLPGAGWP